MTVKDVLITILLALALATGTFLYGRSQNAEVVVPVSPPDPAAYSAAQAALSVAAAQEAAARAVVIREDYEGRVRLAEAEGRAGVENSQSLALLEGERRATLRTELEGRVRMALIIGGSLLAAFVTALLVWPHLLDAQAGYLERKVRVHIVQTSAHLLSDDMRSEILGLPSPVRSGTIANAHQLAYQNSSSPPVLGPVGHQPAAGRQRLAKSAATKAGKSAATHRASSATS